MHLPLPLRRFATLALAGAALVTACGAPCTRKYCAAYLTLAITDATGKPVPKFSGRVTLDGRFTAEFNCDAAELKQGSAFDCLSPGTVRIPNLAQEAGSWVAHVVDDGTRATFDGALAPVLDTVADFNGEGCGGCSTGTAAVQLPPP